MGGAGMGTGEERPVQAGIMDRAELLAKLLIAPANA